MQAGLVILGSHAFAEEVADIVHQAGTPELAGFVENWDRERCVEPLRGLPVDLDRRRRLAGGAPPGRLRDRHNEANRIRAASCGDGLRVLAGTPSDGRGRTSAEVGEAASSAPGR